MYMYKVSKQTHLDSFTKCYKNIIVISLADNTDIELKNYLGKKKLTSNLYKNGSSRHV